MWAWAALWGWTCDQVPWRMTDEPTANMFTPLASMMGSLTGSEPSPGFMEGTGSRQGSGSKYYFYLSEGPLQGSWNKCPNPCQSQHSPSTLSPTTSQPHFELCSLCSSHTGPLWASHSCNRSPTTGPLLCSPLGMKGFFPLYLVNLLCCFLRGSFPALSDNVIFPSYIFSKHHGPLCHWTLPGHILLLFACVVTWWIIMTVTYFILDISYNFSELVGHHCLSRIDDFPSDFV